MEKRVNYPLAREGLRYVFSLDEGRSENQELGLCRFGSDLTSMRLKREYHRQ